MTLTIGCTDRSTGILADGAEILAFTYQVSRNANLRIVHLTANSHEMHGSEIL